ncbi:TIGR04104 family putative zinc finger protein [Alkalihalobacterium elongatum]|uniref:TIGR04104 family putative zinc finger protein n=1 Tax=Alkalihalobacterium elongatum TaxID=2675466 RepID=UPI001C1FC131|nr:TIGR04104 family putative zinc finger protein [Alkalihalobacterium elongatum]
MGLPSCNKCGVQMKWGVINKSLWLGYKPVICEKCNTAHKLSFSSRNLVSFLIVVPMVFFGVLLLNYFHLNIFAAIILMISISLFISLFLPYLVKYNESSNEH